MNSRVKRNIWLSLTVLVAAWLTNRALWYLISEPWHCITEPGGDGAKNIFSYLYHCMYGSGFIMQGMNYPYGEHIVYTDGIPFLSVLQASMGNVSTGTALTVLWWSVGISYVISAVFLGKTLRRFGVNAWLAILFGVIIAIMTPQWLRMRAHHALSFNFVIPMLFYWSVAYVADGKWKYWLWVIIMGFVAGLIHPYFSGIILVWILLYVTGYFILSKDPWPRKIWHSAPPMAAAVIAPGLVMLVVKLTDHVGGRPSAPYISNENYTRIMDVMSSYFSPFWKAAVDHAILPYASTGGEGFSYPGLVPLVVLLAVVPVAYYRKRYLPALPDATEGKQVPFMSPVWVFMALVALVLSAGIPFRWGMEWLKNIFFIFKQFRSMGRFAWIFYYISAVYAVVMVCRWHAEMKSRGYAMWANVLFALVVFVWGYEVKGYVRSSRKLANLARYNYDQMFSVNEENWHDFLTAHGRKADQFQAVLGLKYFNVGTDKIWVGDPGWLIALCARASLQLHLPMIDEMAARSSWDIAKKQVKLVAGPYAAKPMLDDLNNNKPFLLMDYNLGPLDPDQSSLLNASDFIGKFSDCRVYACYPDRIKRNDSIAEETARAAILYMSGDTCINCNSTWVVRHYDNHPNDSVLSGKGALPLIKEKDSIVATLPLYIPTDSVLYEFSCWFLLEKGNYYSPDVELTLVNKTGKTLKQLTAWTTKSTDNRRMWFRTSEYFYVPRDCVSIICRLVNNPRPAYHAMDELQLRPAEGTIISLRDKNMIVNNHFLKTTDWR